MGMKTSKNLKDLSTQNLNIYFKEIKKEAELFDRYAYC